MTRWHAMPSTTALPSDLLSSVGDLVTATTGLHFPPERRVDLERALASAAHDAGCGALDLAATLLRDRDDRRLIETLAGHLTIGETYFFREPEALAVFEGEILPELIRARGTERRIRIWSAGCATGEEPYTIAMILDRLFGNARDWNIGILATDINPRFLRKAAEGVYGEWSFRQMPDGARERWFVERARGRWEVRPRIREMVTFSCLNLADDVYPSLLSGTNAMDVIFCRNVLMYLAPEKAKETAQKFHRSLVPGGWLVAAAAEASKEIFAPFDAVQRSAGTLYRKEADRPRPSHATHARSTSPLSPTRSVAERGRASCETSAPHPSPLPTPPDHHTRGERGLRVEAVCVASALEMLAQARALANEGKLRDAADLCARAIATDKMNPAGHYLLSAIQSELGDRDDAVRSLTRALYADSGFVPAHFGLANIEMARGRADPAKRHLNNALLALRGHSDDEILPESEGLTAGRLKDVIQTLLEAMPSEVHAHEVDE